MTALHPRQTSEQLPPHLAERLHSSDGKMTSNDRHGRRAVIHRASSDALLPGQSENEGRREDTAALPVTADVSTSGRRRQGRTLVGEGSGAAPRRYRLSVEDFHCPDGPVSNTVIVSDAPAA